MKEKRVSVFTVEDAESSIIHFIFSSIFIIITLFIYQWIINGFVISFHSVCFNIAKIISAATFYVILKEGVDIMFLRRYREARRMDKIDKEKLEKELEAIKSRLSKVESDVNSKNSDKDKQPNKPDKNP